MDRRADKRQDAFIQDMQTLVAHWLDADPASFGLRPEQVQSLVDRYHAAADALRKAQKAREVARARTILKRERMAELRREFGALSEIIDGVAKSSGDRGVYARARIRPPGPRTRLPAPPPPEGFEHTLRNDGAIEVTFKIDDGGRGGLLYEVQRQLVPIGRPVGPRPYVDPPFELLMVVAVRRFIDDNVPEGLREVRYRVRAMRSNGGRSDWAQGSTVFFGTQKSAAGTVAGRIRGGGDQSGQDQSGPGQSGKDQAGQDQSGQAQSGQAQSGKDQSGRGRGAG